MPPRPSLTGCLLEDLATHHPHNNKQQEEAGGEEDGRVPLKR